MNFTIFSVRGVFGLAFLYALIVGLFIQLVLLPYVMPTLHAGHGLIMGADWVGFHQNATLLADRISREGWVVWELRPEGNAPTGIAAMVYALTGISEPWVLMPLNAGLFACGAMCLYLMLSTIASSRLAFVAILPYLFFPSATMIYGQLHKDVYSIAGSLLISLAWLRFTGSGKHGWSTMIGQVVIVLAGALLIWVVRPYLLKVALAASMIVASMLLIRKVVLRSPSHEQSTIQWGMGVLLCLMVLGGIPNSQSGVVERVELEKIHNAQTEYAKFKSSNNSIFSLILVPFDRLSFNVGVVRYGFTSGYPTAGSNLDTDVRLYTTADVLGYMPRALQIGLFSPFPDMWISVGVSPGGTMMRLIAGMEMVLAYFLLGGVILVFVINQEQRFITGLIILQALIGIIVLSLVVCNVGTLYRMRYGYWQVLLSLGVVGWGMAYLSWREKIR